MNDITNSTDSAGRIPEELSRTAMLLGDEAVRKLMNSTVAVFGLGGVGGQCAEALCRAGVGRLILVDGDRVSRSNLNRQIIATQAAVGRRKTEVSRERLLSIMPWTEIVTHDLFYDASTADRVDLSGCGCIIDAIDTVTAKLLLIERATSAGIPVVSCMGAGNKLDPSRFEAADISETSFCPLARVMRRELKRRGITSLRVVYSREPAVRPAEGAESVQPDPGRRSVPGSASFCAPAAGLLAASEAVKILLERMQNNTN